MSLYLSCPYAHYLSYVQQLEPKMPARPLFFGSDFHKLLELRNSKKQLKQAYKGIKETFYDLPAKSQAILGENYLDDLKTIFKDYQTIYKDCVLPDLTEEKFEIPIGKINGEPVNFVGVIDELYFRDKKTIIIGEHKTFSTKPDLSMLMMNTQKCLYAKATQKIYGILPQEVMWDYIKSTPSQEPIWLEKSKRFSEAKNNNVTPMSYKRACKKLNITDQEILAKADNYEGNIPNFFFRLNVEYIPDMVERIWDSFKYTAKEICKNAENNKTMNVTRNCSWCKFQPICYAELTGGNVNYTIEKDYQQKSKKE